MSTIKTTSTTSTCWPRAIPLKESTKGKVSVLKITMASLSLPSMVTVFIETGKKSLSKNSLKELLLDSYQDQ